ncbi:S1 family peptidase [Vibrio ouci]|uniref:Serine protease n=1 Tax=Vibrio ouci TaxID=2499078 RepID=A0A4Y8WIP4_9VIBR|nr:serine protease [Vibrio ouci]TFH92475.1 serine protease [Vibrio ouci]
MKHTETENKYTVIVATSSVLLSLSVCALFYSTANVADEINAEGRSSPETDVIGGIKAKPGQFPFMGRLLPRNASSNDRGICGATLIHPRYVLTALHCIDYSTAKGLSVQVGAYDLEAKDGERIDVKNIFFPTSKPIGEYYDDGSGEYVQVMELYDYAVLELTKPSKYPFIELMNPEEFALVKPGELTTTMGWGDNELDERHEQELTALDEQGSKPDHILNYVNVPYVDLEVCKAVGGQYSKIGNESICAGFKEGKKDSCYGDSGGPLLATAGEEADKQVGIVSWGEGCAQPDAYGVYASIPYHLEDIEYLQHGISYTQDYYDLKLMSQSRHGERLDYKNYRDSAVQLGSPQVHEGNITRNTCPEWLAPNQECYVDVTWENTNDQRVIADVVSMPILTPELELLSFIKFDYASDAPSYYSKVLGNAKLDILAYGANWEIDEDIFSEGVSSLTNPKINVGEESVISIRDLPPGKLQLDIMVDNANGWDSIYFNVNGQSYPFYNASIEEEFVSIPLPLEQDNNDVQIIYTNHGNDAKIWIDDLHFKKLEDEII